MAVALIAMLQRPPWWHIKVLLKENSLLHLGSCGDGLHLCPICGALEGQEASRVMSGWRYLIMLTQLGNLDHCLVFLQNLRRCLPALPGREHIHPEDQHREACW